jgi:hypothetical protein
MDYAAFSALKGTEPSADLPLALQGLLWDAKGDWKKAHECAQEQDDREGAWVHAYLHRKEGDLDNAGYWYRRARKPVPTGPLDEEWEAIARGLLAKA